MLDRAIEAYEAHRSELQRLSTTLDVSPSSSSSAQSLTNMERNKIVAEINAVLERHPLRFSESLADSNERGVARSVVHASSYRENERFVYRTGLEENVSSENTASRYRKEINDDKTRNTTLSPRSIRGQTPWNCSLCRSSTNLRQGPRGHHCHTENGAPVKSVSFSERGLTTPTELGIFSTNHGSGAEIIRKEKSLYTCEGTGGTSGMGKAPSVLAGRRAGYDRPNTSETISLYTTSSSPPREGPASSSTPPTPVSHPGSGVETYSPARRASLPYKTGIPLTPWPVSEEEEMNGSEGEVRRPTHSHAVHPRKVSPSLAEQYDAHKKLVSPSTRWPCICSRSPSRSSSAGMKSGTDGERTNSEMEPSKIEEDEHVMDTLRCRPRHHTPRPFSSSFRDPANSTMPIRAARSVPREGDVRKEEREYELSRHLEWEPTRDKQDIMMRGKRKEAMPREEGFEARLHDAEENSERGQGRTGTRFTSKEEGSENRMYSNSGTYYDQPSLPYNARRLRVSPPRRCPYFPGMYERSTSVLRESSPAAIRFMQQEDEDLQRRKEAEERLLHLMAPSSLKDTPGRERETAVIHQLQREQLLLENQLNRMLMERDFLLQRNPKDTGSEPRYFQLHHRIGKVSGDLKRIDREIQIVKGLEQQQR